MSWYIQLRNITLWMQDFMYCQQLHSPPIHPFKFFYCPFQQISSISQDRGIARVFIAFILLQQFSFDFNINRVLLRYSPFNLSSFPLNCQVPVVQGTYSRPFLLALLSHHLAILHHLYCLIFLFS